MNNLVEIPEYKHKIEISNIGADYIFDNFNSVDGARIFKILRMVQNNQVSLKQKDGTFHTYETLEKCFDLSPQRFKKFFKLICKKSIIVTFISNIVTVYWLNPEIFRPEKEVDFEYELLFENLAK